MRPPLRPLALLVLFFFPVTARAAPPADSQPLFPARQWATATPADLNLDESKLRSARDYALTGGGSGMIVRHGRVAITWGDLRQRYDLKSSTKSIGVSPSATWPRSDSATPTMATLPRLRPVFRVRGARAGLLRFGSDVDAVAEISG